MKKLTATQLVFFLLGWLLLLLAAPTTADVPPVTGHQDTDLFMTNPNLGGSRPNVLFIIDNSSNWSQTAQVPTARFNLVQEALLTVIDDLAPNSFNVGIMMMGGSGNIDGGFPLLHIQQLTETLKTDLLEQIGAWTTNEMSGNNAAFAGVMHEAFLYFTADQPRAGHLGNQNSLMAKYRDPDAYSHSIMDHPNLSYISPDDEENPCADNYVIFIANGPPATADTNRIEPGSDAVDYLVGKYGMDDNFIPLPAGQTHYEENMIDEYARFMSGQGITTFTIDVHPLTSGNWPSHQASLRSAAHHGKGKYFDVYDADELRDAIFSALDSIQAIDSVFAASSLPVSVNTRGTHINEVYMAMFRPDEMASPRWMGNLKLFHFKLDELGNLVMADAEDKEAQNPQTGFLTHDAVSHWTYNSNYWEFEERGTPPSASDKPDGEVVEKGGAAQQHRLIDFPAGRTMYTCAPNCTAGNTPSLFNTANAGLSAGLLGVEADERNPLIEWVRGADNQTPAERAAGEARPSLHGDVVHSSPLVINFNRTGDDDDLVVFYSANDGQLRAIRGGRGNPDGGRELWSYIPNPFLGSLKQLYHNDYEINTPSVPKSSLPNFENNKPYLFDGHISSYVFSTEGNIDVEQGDKAWLFATVRRGGRFMTAMDVSDPENPQFMWQKGCTDGSCDPGYQGIGQTWSEPVVRRVRLMNDDNEVENRLVLIVGAGYHAEGEDPYPQEDIAMGQGIMIIDAETGEMLVRIGPETVPDDFPTDIDYVAVEGMDYSIPATVVALNRGGSVYRLYAPDTGGNIWRIDLVDETGSITADPSKWQGHKLAALGGDGYDVRKFLHRVDVASARDGNGNYYAILIGSGDREKPFETYVENRFYMLKDRAILGQAYGDTLTDGDLLDVTTDTDPSVELLNATEGWYIRLRPGEKVVGRAESRAGSVFFGTNQPAEMVATDSCVSDLGVARSYEVAIGSGGFAPNRTSRDVQLGPNVGFPPPYIHVVVQVKDPNNPDGPPVIVEGVTSGADTRRISSEGLGTRVRQYWHMEIDD